jgi:hypothetical protein
MCKNIMKIFQKFEMLQTQTCTFLKNNTLDIPKGVIVVCFHFI